MTNHGNARGLTFEYAGAHGASVDRPAQRAKPRSAAGQMVAFSSPDGKKLSSPAPVSLSEAKISFWPESSSEVCSEQTEHSDKVARRFAARRVCKHRYREDRFQRNDFAKFAFFEMAVPGVRLLRFRAWGGTLGGFVRVPTEATGYLAYAVVTMF